MKVLVLLMCVAGGAYGGAVAWPGGLVTGSVVRTVIPAQTKAVGYSTTQYINSLPLSYSVGAHPNFAFGVPHVRSYAPVQQAYYPIAGASYYPSSSVFYPSLSPLGPDFMVGSVPSFPAGISDGLPSGISASFPSGIPAGLPGGILSEDLSGQAPSAPENSASDADTAVVDSAEYPQQQQQEFKPSSEAPVFQPSPPQSPPPSTFPSFPQIPQLSGESPSFPQIPQFPQGSLPGYPQFPQFPSNPFYPQSPTPSPSPPSSFPGGDRADQGLNDEDTVSVESA